LQDAAFLTGVHLGPHSFYLLLIGHAVDRQHQAEVWVCGIQLLRYKVEPYTVVLEYVGHLQYIAQISTEPGTIVNEDIVKWATALLRKCEHRVKGMTAHGAGPSDRRVVVDMTREKYPALLLSGCLATPRLIF
jgi:hypothetical protein